VEYCDTKIFKKSQRFPSEPSNAVLSPSSRDIKKCVLIPPLSLHPRISQPLDPTRIPPQHEKVRIIVRDILVSLVEYGPIDGMQNIPKKIMDEGLISRQ